MTKVKKNPHRGSRFEDYLEDDGALGQELSISLKDAVARDGYRADAYEGDKGMRSFAAWKRKQMKNPTFKKEYDALEEEFALIGELLKARTRAKLTQAQVAKRMGTSQSAVARLESGRLPSLASLRKYAQATGSRVEIKLPKAG